MRDQDLYEVSVVIPAYCAEPFIGRAISSVLSQTGVRADVVVVVDASPDETAATAERFADVRVVVNSATSGAPASRNRGLRLSRAPFVMFLDADDHIEDPLLSSLLRALKASGADVALGPSAHQDVRGRRTPNGMPTVSDAPTLIADWLRGSGAPTCAVLWRREFVAAIGGWDEGIIKNQDGDLVFRAAQAGARFVTASTGLGVQHDYPSPHRVSGQTSAASLECRATVLERALAVPAGLSIGSASRPSSACGRLRSAVAQEYYKCAVDAFDSAFDDAGQRYLTRARELGFEQHAGSVWHRLLSRLVGVRRSRRVLTQVRLLLRTRRQKARQAPPACKPS